MKKTISIIIALSMVISLAACGNKEVEEKGIFTAGTYDEVGTGKYGDVAVSTTFTSDRIEKIVVGDHSETQGFFEVPVEKIPAAIIESQSLAVDVITGATMTSDAILEAVEKAAVNAGADISKLKEKVNSEEKPGESVEYTTDVVVVGAGIAGLSAALEAHNNGAKVILIEKMPIAGGSTIRSGGKILAAGTDIQKANGIEDTPEAFKDFLVEVGENEINEEYAAMIANNSAENIQWLIDNGVEMNENIEVLHSTIQPARGLWTAEGTGAGFTQPLEAKLKEEKVEILYSTPATELIEKDGTVIGVMASNDNGDTITINAEVVILATGGYTHNKEMMAEFHPFLKNVVTNTSEGNTGDGIIMGEKVGANLIMKEGAIDIATNPMTYYGYGEEFKGLFVSESGERFLDESIFHFTRTRVMLEKGINNFWAITPEYNDRVGESIAAGFGFEANTIEELQELIKGEKLIETVNQYNALAKNGSDTDFGKKAEYMKPIEGEKVYALKMILSNSGTFGGLDTDIDSRVVREDGTVIKGLYAAGEVGSGHFLHKEYPGSGTAIISFLTFGRIAGENAANDIK